ncbi:MAG TPA: hypothetical protein VEM76_21030 [Anaeromyxobacteraceae bacterium]|nr:hypothetical protein [Anaeromyxobacteraceae bacterium]
MTANRCAVAAALALAGAASCAGGRPRTPAADPSATPLEVTRAFYRALHQGDATSAAQLIDLPEAGRATGSFVEMARAFETLENAIVERFGRAGAAVVGYAERVAAEDEALRTARAEVRGDTATVLADHNPLARLRRVNGSWRLALDEALSTEIGLATLARQADASAAAAERVVPFIRAGLFADPRDALEAFHNEAELAEQGATSDLPRLGPSQEKPSEPEGFGL